MFSEFRPAVEHVLKSFHIEPNAPFMQLVKDELAEVSSEIQHHQPEKHKLDALYDLRATYLDWELGTGYLGFFSKNAGTRYTFTKRLEAVFQMLPASLTQQGKPDEEFKVLEIGCGAGLLCLELAKNASHVVGIDISHVVLDFANHMKDYLGCGNVLFQHGDAEHLAFEDESFDVVICSEVLEHLLDPQTVLKEIRRVVKQNGTVILTTPCAVSLSDLCMSAGRIFHKSLESEKDIHFDKKTWLAARRKGQQLTDEACMRVHLRFHYPNLVEMFHQAGLSVEQAEGTVFAFPPHYQVFYRYCPGFMLLGIRLLEKCLNLIHLFQRFGSVTTCFRLKPV